MFANNFGALLTVCFYYVIFAFKNAVKIFSNFYLNISQRLYLFCLLTMNDGVFAIFERTGEKRIVSAVF